MISKYKVPNLSFVEMSKNSPRIHGSLTPMFPFANVYPKHGMLHGDWWDIDKVNKYKEKFVLKNNDVLLCSYPKCGHHLLAKTCMEITKTNDGDNCPDLYKTADLGTYTNPLIEAYFGNTDHDEIDERMQMTSDLYPRLWWSHCSYSHVPVRSFEDNSKMIVITRNPKDTVVSNGEFYKKLLRMFEGNDADTDTAAAVAAMTVDDMMSYMLRGIVPWGCYFKWYEDFWNKYKENTHNILWLYYEDMIDNPLPNVKNIANFIYDGKCDKSVLNIDEKGYNEIVENISFDKVKKQTENEPQTFELGGMFRKGVNYDWMNHLNQKQSDLIDETMYFKWAENCSEIEYYKELMERFNPLYNNGYFK